VAAIFGLPLVLAGATRSRVLLWILTALLVTTTFVVYALQIPPGAFSPKEIFFVNRLLNAISLLLLAGLLHIWMRSATAREAQARVIKEQNEKLQAARVSRRMIEVQEAERRAHAIGVSGVPFFIFARRLAVSGAQPVDVLVQAIAEARSAAADEPAHASSAS